MLEVILISWAALGLSLPIVKALGIAGRTHVRKRQRKKTTIRDFIGDVRHMQAAERKAFQQVAKGLCGGDTAPDALVKAATVAMKGLTSYATPNLIDLVDGVSCDDVKKSK